LAGQKRQDRRDRRGRQCRQNQLDDASCPSSGTRAEHGRPTEGRRLSHGYKQHGGIAADTKRRWQRVTSAGRRGEGEGGVCGPCRRRPGVKASDDWPKSAVVDERLGVSGAVGRRRKGATRPRQKLGLFRCNAGRRRTSTTHDESTTPFICTVILQPLYIHRLTHTHSPYGQDPTPPHLLPRQSPDARLAHSLHPTGTVDSQACLAEY
jgi:hypothetical protein